MSYDPFGGEQVSELAPLAPNADIDEIRAYVMRLHNWVRAREPVAAGDSLSKFVIRGELVELGVVSYEAGATGAANSSLAVDTEFTVAASTTPSLELVASGSEYLFATAMDTTSASADIVFTANLVQTTGRVRFHAEAFDVNHQTLGAVTLTSITETTATLTSTNFVAGLGTNVRYVKVTATLGDLSEYAYAYRSDAGVKALIFDVSARHLAVLSSPLGANALLAAAHSTLRILRGADDETSSWSFAISAASCTAQVNDTSGPATGTGRVVVSVSAMAADTASVTITASKASNPDQILDLTLIRASSGITSGLRVITDSGTTVQLIEGCLTICTNASAVTASVPASTAQAGALCGAYFTNSLLTNVIGRNGQNLDEAAANYTVNPRGKPIILMNMASTYGWFRLGV